MCVVRYAQLRKPRRENNGIGQRVTSVPAGLRSREIALEMQEARGRYMGAAVGLFPRLRLCEVVEWTWGQAFVIVKVRRLRNNVAVEIELEDNARHHITLLKESEKA